MTEELPTTQELYAHLHTRRTLHRLLDTHLDSTDHQQMLERFRLIRELRQYTEQALKSYEQEAAENALAAGATWADIGATAGITRQTAQQTYRLQNKTARKLTQPEELDPLDFIKSLPEYPTPADRENLPVFLAQILWAWAERADGSDNRELSALWGEVAGVVESLAGDVRELAEGGAETAQE